MDHPALSSRTVSTSHCSHLRHKGMYVTSVPDPDEARFCGGDYDATAYWCLCTQKAIGPDGNPVHPDTCRDGRACCEH